MSTLEDEDPVAAKDALRELSEALDEALKAARA
jgi:hypothetical protein